MDDSGSSKDERVVVNSPLYLQHSAFKFSARVLRPLSNSVFEESKQREMETSLRYGKDSTALKVHAKQKLRVDANTFLQLHGELNTKIGAPSYLSSFIRHYFPDLKASVGVGLQYDRREKLRYTARGKKSFPVTANELVNFIIKGRCDSDTKFKQTISKGAAELSWSILNFQKEQDVRLKVGYDILDKIPYVQIRENNWTLNADINGKWNVRYDL